VPQTIFISRWKLGEAGPRSAGDFGQEIYPTSCRRLRNFVVSETGKIYRRPGFVHHTVIPHSDVKLVSFYRREDTFILAFWLDGIAPAQTLKVDWYKKVSGILTYQATYDLTEFHADDFLQDRPLAVDLARISHVQLENDLILTHPNMPDPWDLRYDTVAAPGEFVAANFSESNRSWYYDVNYTKGTGDPVVDTWQKLTQVDLTDGGGDAAGGAAGWTAYTGKIFTGKNQGKGPDGTPPQTFKYLSCVTFSFERLVWARGSFVHGSAGGDPDGLGIQLNGNNDQSIFTIDPFQLIASDPFIYQASSDLGYEDFYWLASGSLLMGGANNGAWVLSNAQAGGLDATNPLMYKSTSHGAFWVPGKVVGDAMLYFQRPGRQLNEFLFNQATQNYEATNLSEYSSHIFFDSQPRGMELQRSPFNIAWIVREDGALVSFTYDRLRGIVAWAQHPFVKSLGEPTQFEGGEVKSLCIYSDGLIDAPVVHIKRENSDGVYYALEVMAEYTPADSQGIFCDASLQKQYAGPYPVTAIIEDSTNGHVLHISGTLAVGETIKFIDAQRVDDGAPASDKGDYIYGTWEIIEVVATNEYRMKNELGETYRGIWEFSPPATENAYTNYGSARVVTKQPDVPGDFLHLRGVFCVSLMDGNPHPVYVSRDGATFYNSDTFAEDWDGDEASLTPDMENKIWFTHLTIGRSYESSFSPFILKKQINKGKITKIELELFRSLGGKVGTANVSRDDQLQFLKLVDITYPSKFEEFELYDGTIKPKVVGGYGDDPLWLVLVDEAVPFNIMNVIFFLEAT